MRWVFGVISGTQETLYVAEIITVGTYAHMRHKWEKMRKP